MTYELINSRPSPYGRRVAIALLEKKVPFTIRFDEPWGNESCTGSYSPLQQLPILLTPRGEVVYDSVYILEWLEIMHPALPLLPSDSGDRLAALKLKMLGERLMEVAQSIIFESQRPDPSAAWLTRQVKKIDGGLAAIEDLLSSQVPDHAEPVNLGQIAVATTALVWEFAVSAGLSPDVPEFRWRDRYSRLTALVTTLAGRPSFLRTEPKTMNIDIQAQMS